jgi:hypothetical protein
VIRITGLVQPSTRGLRSYGNRVGSLKPVSSFSESEIPRAHNSFWNKMLGARGEPVGNFYYEAFS